MIELTNLAASAMPLDVARPRDAPASEGTDFALIEAALAEQILDPDTPVTADDPTGGEAAAPDPSLAEDTSRTHIADSAADTAVAADRQAPDPLEAWLDARTGLSAWLAPEPAMDMRMAGPEAPQPKASGAALLAPAATSDAGSLAGALVQAAAPEASAERTEVPRLSAAVAGTVAGPAAAQVEPPAANSIPASPQTGHAMPFETPKAEDPRLNATSLPGTGQADAKREAMGLSDAALEPDTVRVEPSRVPLADGDADAPVVERGPLSPIIKAAPKAAPDSQTAARSLPLSDQPRLAGKDVLATGSGNFDEAARTPVETTRPLETSVAPARPAPGLAQIPTGIEGLRDHVPGHDMPSVEAALSRREANAAVQPVARQIVAALVPPPTNGGVQAITAAGVTEIALSPEELGRVQISVSGHDKPLVVITAERPETLELLRRNADLLGAELREAGLEGGALSFRDGPPPEPQRLLRETAEDGTETTAIPVIPLAIAQEAGRLAAQRRIDIRL